MDAHIIVSKQRFQFQSNAYHPESQGALERFHQTINNIINTFCLDSQRDRNYGVHMLLFAAREAFIYNII
jgi:hypothetical protein